MLKRHLVKFGAAILLIAGVGIGGAAVFAQKTPNASPLVEKPVMRPIPTAVAQPVADARTHLFPGEVRANRRVELAFSVAGLLNKLSAQEGRTIKKGQVIATLDQRDFQFAYDAAKAKCSLAKHDLDRFSSLWKQNVVSMADYENAKTKYDVAQAEMLVKKKALADTVLYAPFNGVVVSRHVEDHEHILAKQSILSFQDISTIDVLIQVPECMIAQGGVEGFDHLLVHFDADTETGRWLKAKVREHSAKSDPATRTYEVAVALSPPPDLKLYPGMTAAVKVQIQEGPQASEKERATRIPVEALCCGSDGAPYVWVIPSTGGNPRKQNVETAALTGDSAVIRSGLKPGSHVAVAGLHFLGEELLVRPVVTGEEGLDG